MTKLPHPIYSHVFVTEGDVRQWDAKLTEISRESASLRVELQWDKTALKVGQAASFSTILAGRTRAGTASGRVEQVKRDGDVLIIELTLTEMDDKFVEWVDRLPDLIAQRIV